MLTQNIGTALLLNHTALIDFCLLMCLKKNCWMSGKQGKPWSDATFCSIRFGPEIIKRFSCSTQLSMKFVLLINLTWLTFANSSLLNIAEHESFSANKYENANYCWHFHIYLQRTFMLSWFEHEKSFITSRPGLSVPILRMSMVLWLFHHL